MDLYALLIGINEYPSKPLTQCVNDVKKVEKYLKTLKSHFSQIHLLKLLDKKAGKAAIIKGISQFLSQAKDEDIAMMYYSGHGAQEKSGGIFADDQDGLMECLVACPDSMQDSGFLLADKEIRYLFSKLPNTPHLISVFDCCHSGDIVRSLGDDGQGGRSKRLVQSFPARNYSDFVFSSEIAAPLLRDKYLSELIPWKNHVHLAACLPDELSWEDENGGVFTRYLMQLLEATKGRLNYQDVARWARISLKDITRKKQTPTYSIQGEGKLSPDSSWMNLYPDSDASGDAKIIFNKLNGWIYTRGQLMGVREGTAITVLLDGDKKFDTVVTTAGPEFSVVKVPPDKSPSLDTNKEYQAMTGTTWSELGLFVNVLERDEQTKSKIETFLGKQPGVRLVSAGAADFYVNIFNQMVYFSLPGDEFRPLAEQIDLLKDANNLETILKKQLSAVLKWNHFNTLANPDAHFDRPPIRVEISQAGEKQFTDVTDSSYDLDPKSFRTNGMFFQQFKINVTNISGEKLYIGVLTLNSDFGISSKPFDNSVIALEPGASKSFYDHTTGIALATLDGYKEVYNWKSEWFHYKFIVNNFQDFTTSLKDFIQNRLNPPLLPDIAKTVLRGMKGEGGAEELEEVTEKWGTFKTTVHLKNPSYNQISGELEKHFDHFMNDERIAPFIGMLYFSQVRKGLILESHGKSEGLDEAMAEKGFWDVKINIANYLDDMRRLRLFRKLKEMMPDRPLVVAEGDSWFLYPFLVKDTIDYVMEELPVRSLAAAGDTLDNYKKSGQLLREIEILQPEYVLISGGGNDIIGPEIVHILKKNAGQGKKPEEYLNENYNDRRKKLRELYEFYFTELKKSPSVKRVFVHGYDYVRADHPGKIILNGWVNKYMMEFGIKDAEDRAGLIRYLVDNFNSDLEDLTRQHDIARYLDMRGLVAQNEWYDEIHPNDTGFAKVGQRFIAAIKNN